MAVRRVGIVLRSLTIHHTKERKLEPYFLAYATTDTQAPTEEPTSFRSLELRGQPRGEKVTFHDMLLIPPVPVGELFTWRLELWESDDDFRKASEKIQKARDAVFAQAPTVQAVASAIASGAAIGYQTVIATIATIVAEILRRNQDDLLVRSGGSALIEGGMFAEAQRGTLALRGKKAEIEIGFMLTEGPDPIVTTATTTPVLPT